jgi:hypothetical protein
MEVMQKVSRVGRTIWMGMAKFCFDYALCFDYGVSGGATPGRSAA